MCLGVTGNACFPSAWGFRALLAGFGFVIAQLVSGLGFGYICFVSGLGALL